MSSPPDYTNLLGVGDSKMTSTYTWFTSLISSVNGAGYTPPFMERPTRYAVSGKTVAYWAANIQASISSSLPYNADKGIIILGANDLVAGAEYFLRDGTGAAWLADWHTVLDALFAKSPNARFWIGLAWRQGYDALCDTMANLVVNSLIPAYGSRLRQGMDERIWIKAGDDGATNTVDGIHPNAAGNAIYVTQYALLTA